MSKVTVSAKIDVTLRKQLYELGIKPSEVIKKALQDEVKKKKQKALAKKIEDACSIISRVSREEWADTVRQNRDER